MFKLRDRNWLHDAAFISLVSVIGLALGLQGWNSRGMNFDLIIFIESAHDLLARGILPDRGDISSYASFSTPGTAWLMVPGILLFRDPRLYEIIGSSFLYIGTLSGIFLLTRICFGTAAAYLSVLLYGLSRNGLFFAGSVWPIGHPFFYVWMVYFCLEWVRQKSANYLAAAVITWSAGMYVDMAIAPAFFVIPAVWLLCQSPAGIRSLMTAGVIVSVIWYPYLRLQVSRDFADLRSLILRQKIFPSNYKDSWCDPALTIKRWEQPEENKAVSVENGPVTTELGQESRYRKILHALSLRLGVVREGLIVNFEQMTYFPIVGFGLLILALSSLGAMCLSPFVRNTEAMTRQVNWQRVVLIFSCGMLVLALLFNEISISYFFSADGILEGSTIQSVRWLQALFALLAIILLTQQDRVSSLLNRRLTFPASLTQRVETPMLLAIGLLIPWIVLLLVAEPARPERYWWIWPLQIVALAASTSYFPIRLRLPRVIAWAAPSLLAFLLLLHPTLLSHAQSWWQTGWVGATAPQVEAIELIANQLRSEGRNKAAIGYQTFTYGFAAQYNVIDSRYKLGAELDLLLKYRHEVFNTTQCAEGVSPADEFRIVQTRPKQLQSPKDFLNEPPQEYFQVSLDGTFHLLRQFGDYQVFRRSDSV